MLLSWIHTLAAQPRVYDLIQTISGGRILRKRVSRHFQVCSAGGYIIDAGGGTGAIRSVVPSGCHYVCLDVDPLKLHDFYTLNKSGAAVLGSAAQMPFPDNSAEYIFAFGMCHHLTDEELNSALAEFRRALKPGGRLVLLEPVLAPHRLASRILWRLDRGSNPRSADVVAALIQRHLQIVVEERYAVLHRYITAVAVK
ncbi:MAG: class I SAM-dependent methyltransferase [Bryobacteraceae bacterium]